VSTTPEPAGCNPAEAPAAMAAAGAPQPSPLTDAPVPAGTAPVGGEPDLTGVVLTKEGACITTTGRHYVGVLTAEERARMIAPGRRTWAERAVAR